MTCMPRDPGHYWRVSRWLSVYLLIFAIPGLAPLGAAPSPDPVSEARAALNEGIPAVAAAKLRKMARNTTLTPEQEMLFIESLVRSGEPASALERLEEAVRTGATLEPGPSAFWQAQALAQLDRWAEATPLYQRALSLDLPEHFLLPASLGQARGLLIEGRATEAIETLRNLLSDFSHVSQAPTQLRLTLARAFLEAGSPDRVEPLLRDLLPDPVALREGVIAEEIATAEERRLEPLQKQALLLVGQALLAQDQPRDATEIFNAILRDTAGLEPGLVFLATTLKTDAALRAGNLSAAEEALLNYVRNTGAREYLDRAFARLHEIYTTSALEPGVALTPFLDANQAPEKRAPARFWLAQILIDRGAEVEMQQAVQLLEDFLAAPDLKEDPLYPLAALELLELYGNAGQPRQQIRLFEDLENLDSFPPEVRARVLFRAAGAFFARENFDEASRLYAQAAATDSSLALQALFDETLAWLGQNPDSRFFEEFLAERGVTPGTKIRIPLMLMFARRLAELGDYTNARKALDQVIAEADEEHAQLKAQLLRAHVEFAGGDPVRARQILEELQPRLERFDDPALLAEGDSLAFWITENLAPGATTELQNLARDFITAWPESPFALPIWFKLGEMYFEQDQFPRAQREFELVAAQSQDPALRDAARFYAAMAAARSMNERAQERAVELLRSVAEGDGTLAAEAVIELARLRQELGDHSAALDLLEDFLDDEREDTALDERMRFEALQTLAQVHFDMAGDNPEHLPKAIATAEKLLAQPNLPLELRNFALFLKGRALQRQELPDEALLTFHQALEKHSAPNAPPEFLWFFRAGFAAADLLETQGHPESAIAVLEKLVAAGGPRSQEAQQRVSLLRLRHFLWEDEPAETAANR